MCDFVIHCVIIMSVSRLVGSHIGYAIYGLKKGLITIALHNLVANLASFLVLLNISLGKLQE